jgi:hypothetical protein
LSGKLNKDLDIFFTPKWKTLLNSHLYSFPRRLEEHRAYSLSPFHSESRLSPIRDPLENPNSKWASNTIPIVSNKVPIRKTYFGYQERHNPNMCIISPQDLAGRIFF